MAQSAQYVTLGIAGELLAMPVERVREILDLQPIARLPGAPSHLLGMIDVRGQGVPVLDLRLKLGFMPGEDDGDTRVMVITATVAGADAVIGVKVDRVHEVTVLDSDRLEPPPGAAAGWRAETIAGIGRRNGRFVTVLDFERVFGAADIAVFELA
ncbi:chemotaxis protein CheW [Phaeovulum sp.]|uniref:chemotaxis protein CheW n=1 Tax=Phaeovulum sp. TaxID=2934796 RepID=UPI003568209A